MNEFRYGWRRQKEQLKYILPFSKYSIGKEWTVQKTAKAQKGCKENKRLYEDSRIEGNHVIGYRRYLLLLSVYVIHNIPNNSFSYFFGLILRQCVGILNSGLSPHFQCNIMSMMNLSFYHNCMTEIKAVIFQLHQ